MRAQNMMLAAAMVAMASVGGRPADEIQIAEPRRERRAPRLTAGVTAETTHTAKFIGDGFDQERIDRAERKRARKSARRGDVGRAA